MAEGRGSQTQRGIFVGGRARALLNAMAYFENERVGRGRAGRRPNLRVNNDNNERGVTRQEVGLPHGRAHALRTLIPGPGGLIMEREGQRPLSLYTHHTSLHQPHFNLWVEDFPFHPHLIYPLPLKIVPHL